MDSAASAPFQVLFSHCAVSDPQAEIQQLPELPHQAAFPPLAWMWITSLPTRLGAEFLIQVFPIAYFPCHSAQA